VNGSRVNDPISQVIAQKVVASDRPFRTQQRASETHFLTPVVPRSKAVLNLEGFHEPHNRRSTSELPESGRSPLTRALEAEASDAP
jgi:hypothetical protein